MMGPVPDSAPRCSRQVATSTGRAAPHRISRCSLYRTCCTVSNLQMQPLPDVLHRIEPPDAASTGRAAPYRTSRWQPLADSLHRPGRGDVVHVDADVVDAARSRLAGVVASVPGQRLRTRPRETG